MTYRSGTDCTQYGLFATPLDEPIAPDNMVRVFDVFYDNLDLQKFGFKHTKARQYGAPAYEPALPLV